MVVRIGVVAMMWRLKEVPKYSSSGTTVSAEHYNVTRLALRRISGVIRIPLEGLSHIDMIIDDDSWVCVDRTMNDLPIVAWTNFSNATRGLHEPINCQLHYYHFCAGKIARNALIATKSLLDSKLRKKVKNAVVLTKKPTYLVPK